ncbi:MAG: ORF6N domain-containing protein [Muribaculaceae bacterium]|nr:ORF6N domain-containing protein [Muribaculaceae bacterium]MDE6796093.1 ORF6N domain-containing protein [Muribaculaceae bacterium]
MEENKDTLSLSFSGDSNSGLMPIEKLIHIIRGQQVMIDSDLARLYEVETRRLNEQVKRNIERFPDDFMFQLTKEEVRNLMSQIATSSSGSQFVTLNDAPSNLKSQNETSSLRSQNATLNGKREDYSTKESEANWGGTRKLPYAFTENGVAMLSSVLRSKTAIEVNIRIMRAFTAMRSFLLSNAHIFKRLETIEYHQLLMQRHLSEHDKKIDEVLTRLNDKETEPIEGFFYEGQIFDAYSLISDLVRKADTRIILIDNYVDDRVLKTLDKRKEGVSATVFTNPRNSQINLDIRKHNAQYPEINLRHCTNVHDRFLIIDDTVYFIGGSIKDLGKKIVAFSQMHQSPDDILSKIK